MPTKELAINQFYLLVNRSGFILKTKSEKDYNDVLRWGGIMFSGVVKNSQWLHFRIGSTWLRKLISQLPISKESDDIFFQDVNELDMKSGLHIYEIKLGGRLNDAIYEKL
jgi:hypothetical protein